MKRITKHVLSRTPLNVTNCHLEWSPALLMSYTTPPFRCAMMLSVVLQVETADAEIGSRDLALQILVKFYSSAHITVF